MASSSDFGFSQCVFYALSQLQMANISLNKEHRSSMEAICNGHDVFVWLPTGYGTNKPVLSSFAIYHGLQTRTSRITGAKSGFSCESSNSSYGQSSY